MNEECLPPNETELSTEEPLYLLCVDDEVDLLSALIRLFRKESFRVLTATSGKEALGILKKTKNIEKKNLSNINQKNKKTEKKSDKRCDKKHRNVQQCH